ncbi:AimR family lysis-lysogeny pheromone receptor [Cytobacillus massiliigabonensis]|uniref:AimR family lysis-lysogeny pheromone receptor n=1 Tax=Cytobacillus massiliigabonensis TaxID=1871011 RepID=UPI000C82247D|nr:AimR family lysis-lysogeny pheromone receptor [Cytobacillus massiliigabonensis]
MLAIVEEVLDSQETKITWKDIAEIAGLTKSALSQAKSGNSELNFNSLLKIAKFVFKSNYVSIFKDTCLKFSQPKNIRYALEFLAINRQLPELKKLIRKIEQQHTNSALLEWAEGYSILLKYLSNTNPSDVLNEIRTFTPKTIEIKTLIIITEIWCRNKMREYSTMNALISGVDVSLDRIKEEFIKQSYTMRYKEVLAYIHLYKFNNKFEARKYAEEIISENLSATFTANASYLLGMSYLFDNYEMCLGYIERHRDLLKIAGRTSEIRIVEENDIPFIKNVWKKHEQQPETNDISEKAHYEAHMGDKLLGLNLIEESIATNGISGFKLYYKGLLTGDKSLFMQSLIFFVNKKGDKFYANLPYEHLKNDKSYKDMADLLMND